MISSLSFNLQQLGFLTTKCPPAELIYANKYERYCYI